MENEETKKIDAVDTDPLLSELVNLVETNRAVMNRVMDHIYSLTKRLDSLEGE